MTTFESKTDLPKSIQEVFSFLSDFNNHQALMPENIYNWSSTQDEAKFTIQNMAKLHLQISERVENSGLKITPLEKPPFDLTIEWQLKGDENHTQATFLIHADLNMMMKMIASQPLQKLASFQTEQLKNSF